MNSCLCLIVVVLLMCLSKPAAAADMEITPFRTVNQSPLTRIFGLPAQSEATLVPAGLITVNLTQDIANSYTDSATAREQIMLDGESYRWVLAASYGFGQSFEAGIEVPYLLDGGGFLDSFILEWHKTFSLSHGRRNLVAKNQLKYSYTKDDVQKLKVARAGSGIGDISLTAGMNIHETRDSDYHDSLALRFALKLPTGDSTALHGSGSTDFALSLCGSMNNFTRWGSLGLFGSIGGMAMTDGRVLRDQQQNLAGFGSIGLGWGPAEWLSFKLQLNCNTSFYRGSSLTELADNSLLLVVGGALKLPGNFRLDIGVSEDVAVATAPDVAFHLGLSQSF